MAQDDNDDPTLTDVLLTLKDISEKDVDEGAEIVVMTDVKVGSGGRLHIPKEKRERYDIEEGDFIDAILRTPAMGGGD